MRSKLIFKLPSDFEISDSLENHSGNKNLSEFVRKRKVKKRLANLNNSTTNSEQSSSILNIDENLSTLESTTISNTEVLSPEEWLENFYNGKNLLRSKQKSKQIKKPKKNEKFKNFPMIPKHKQDKFKEVEHG